MGQIIQRGIIDCGLASCPNPDSWKPYNYDKRNAKRRAYVPNFRLLWANTGDEVVSSLVEYDQGRFRSRPPLHDGQVLYQPCSESGVDVPSNVIERFRAGTGMYCDAPALIRLIQTLPEDRWTPKLGAAIGAVGYRLGIAVNPKWKQNAFGRVHARSPAVINMPSDLLAVFRNVEGHPLWCVDFLNFELRIACNETGQKTPDGDIYAIIGNKCGLDRSVVKGVINPILHGQTVQHIRFGMNCSQERIQNRRMVEDALCIALPALYSNLKRLTHDPQLLQRSGARLFFNSLSAAIRDCAIRHVGLPKHDGWVFAATFAQAEAVRAAMQAEVEQLTGKSFPLKLERV